MARAVADQVVLATAPRTAQAMRMGLSEYLAEFAEPCAVSENAPREQRFLRRRDVALWGGDLELALGSAWFYRWFDASFGRGTGGTIAAMLALAATKGEPEPDVLDVLATSFVGNTATAEGLDLLLADFAVARAHVDALYMDSAFTDWSVAWPDQPRSLLPKGPLAPTGASYVLVDTSQVPATARLRLEIEWETHAKMKWVAVRLAKSGAILSRQILASQTRATHVNATVPVDQASSLLLVGVHTGHPVYALDPDEGEWEPHSWMLSLAGE
jgi:hypothetical protein